MNATQPKQYLLCAGMPVLLHTLALFNSIEECERIVLATDNEARVRELLSTYGLHIPLDIVPGGARRQDSVRHAIDLIDDDCLVLVHDVARPCISVRHVREVAGAAAEYGAALLAIPARDTLKLVRDGMVAATLDRSSIWQAQTPQAARASLFRQAFADSAYGDISVTDDAGLLERAGIPVRVVMGDSTNIKITEAEDLAIAEAILNATAGVDT